MGLRMTRLKHFVTRFSHKSEQTPSNKIMKSPTVAGLQLDQREYLLKKDKRSASYVTAASDSVDSYSVKIAEEVNQTLCSEKFIS